MQLAVEDLGLCVQGRHHQEGGEWVMQKSG